MKQSTTRNIIIIAIVAVVISLATSLVQNPFVQSNDGLVRDGFPVTWWRTPTVNEQLVPDLTPYWYAGHIIEPMGFIVDVIFWFIIVWLLNKYVFKLLK